MRSAERLKTRLVAGAAIGLLLAGTLAACNTTQQTAARLKVRSKRLLADRRPIEVSGKAPGVKVLRASLLRGTGGAAVAVALRNNGPKPINDLPLEVGLDRGGHFVPLNRKPTSYFQAHAPALAPGENGTWVFTTHERARQGNRGGPGRRGTESTGDAGFRGAAARGRAGERLAGKAWREPHRGDPQPHQPAAVQRRCLCLGQAGGAATWPPAGPRWTRSTAARANGCG